MVGKSLILIGITSQYVVGCEHNRDISFSLFYEVVKGNHDSIMYAFGHLYQMSTVVLW